MAEQRVKMLLFNIMASLFLLGATQSKTHRMGSFTLAAPAGWERAPAQAEKENGAYMLADVEGARPGAKPVIVCFSYKSASYGSEAERARLLESFREKTRASHPKGFRVDRVRIAGVETERLGFDDGETTTYYLSPYDGAHVFLIIVDVPASHAPFPPKAGDILATLQLARVATASRPLPKMATHIPAPSDLPSETRQTSSPIDRALASRDLRATQNPVPSVATIPAGAGIVVRPNGSTTSKVLAASDRVWARPAPSAPLVAVKSPPIQLDPLFNVRLLSKQQFSGGASTAVAALRELAGPSAIADDARLGAKWAPYLAMPAAGAEEYFDTLNPLLAETLALRSAVATAALEFDGAWKEAGTAAIYGSESGVREALAIADQHRKSLDAVQVRMAEITRRVRELGNPPDPILAAATARWMHRAAIATTRKELPATKPVGQAGAWVLQRVERFDVPSQAEIDGAKLEAKWTDTSYHHRAAYDHYSPYNQGVDNVHETTRFDAEWNAPPATIAPGTANSFTIRFTREYFTNSKAPRGFTKIYNNCQKVVCFSDMLFPTDPSERRIVSLYQEEHGVSKGYYLGAAPRGLDGHPTSGTVVVPYDAPRGVLGQKLKLFVGVSPSCVEHFAGQQEGHMTRIYHYAWTTDSKAITEAGMKPLDEDAVDAAGQQGAVDFHQANIRIIERNLQADRDTLAKESDLTRRASFEWRILQMESDRKAEQDLIASIRTGEIVHTRSPFDDYAHDRFVDSIKENQWQMEEFQRATAALQRIAALLPDSESEDARRFIDRQMSREVLAKMDLAAVRKVAAALNEKSQGYEEQKRASAEEKEAWAQLGLSASTNIKWAADKGMMVCSIFGGRGVMVAYEAATGYVEGGPTEAILRSAAWISTPTYVASEAMRGYGRPDENGKPRGWVGAAEDAGMAFMFAKLFDYGAAKLKGGPQGALTVAEQKELAAFNRGRQQGEARAREFARLQRELEQAARAGASPQKLTALQRRVRDAATTVHADPHAKNYLKYKGDFHAQRAYNAHMGGVHANVEGRFHELMTQRGWNRQPLREFRNASSAGSVGMDHDIGLDEAAAGALRRNGKPASLHEWQSEAQRSWDDAYRQVTGQSASRSWETVTTSGHGEAYKDLNWLSGDKSQVQRIWGQQAADVTRYKNWHMLHDPALSRMSRLQEVSRGTAKDIGTKLQPLLNAAKPKNAASAEALQQARRHWQKVSTLLEAFGNNTLDPITASRRIREATGGKDIPQVVDEMATLLESLVREVGK